MNGWLIAATVLLVAGTGSGLVQALRGNALRRLVGLELATAQTVLVLLLLSRGYARSSYLDVALLLALLSFAGSLVFVRFLERWR